MILSPADTLYAYGKIHDAYDGVERIDDYFRMKKMERIKKIPTPLFGMSWMISFKILKSVLKI